MPDYRRVRVEGGTYFFTVVTYHRHPILISKAAMKFLHAAWSETQARFPFTTMAICLLPDHLHCIWKLPDGDTDYSLRWNMVKGLFSKRYIKEFGPVEQLNALQHKRREAAIWQRRFWEHTILDDDDLETHIDYIHYNPIKHGYVEQAIDWNWSSFRRFVNDGVYDSKWAGEDEGRLSMVGFE